MAGGATSGASFLFSGPFVTLKIVFVDLLLACCRLASEINQGYALLMIPETFKYGIATFGVTWLPGVCFAIHVLSVNRKQWIWYRTILSALGCVVFYPIAPILAILNFLWKKPDINESKRRSVFTKSLKEAQYSCTMTQAIHGGIALPIQLCYQLWLAINGIVSYADDGITWNTIRLKDWEGNEIIIPIAAPICIFLISIGIIKTSWDINAINLGRVTGLKNLWKYYAFGFDFLPFSISVAFFRIWAVLLIITYLNQVGFIPIGIFWLFNVAISQKLLSEPSEGETKNSIWLMSFMGVFIPAYFRPKYKKQSKKTRNQSKRFVSKQQRLLRYQCIASLFIYVPALIACMFMVNLPSKFMYGTHITIDNVRFNSCLGIVILEGIISTGLSFHTTSSGIIRRLMRSPPNVSGRSSEGKSTMKTVSSSDINGSDVKPRTLSSKVNKTKSKDGQKRKASKKGNKSGLNKGVSFSLASDGENVSPVLRKKQRKNTRITCKQRIIYILGCWIILILVLWPCLKCFDIVIFSESYKHRSYIYFKGNVANELIVIEAINIPEVGMVKRVMNILFRHTMDLLDIGMDHINERASGNVLFLKNSETRSSEEAPFKGKVLIMNMNVWEERRKEGIEDDRNATAILIVNKEDFRPSSPIKNIKRFPGDPSPNIYLIRKENKFHLLKYLKNMEKVNIIHDRRKIPEPIWKCNLPLKGCLNDNYQDGFVAGNESMTMECYYGNNTCFGFNNNKKVHNYCSGPETKVCPLNDEGFGFSNVGGFATLEFDGVTRNFKCSPNYCASNILEEEIPKCDEGLQEGITSGWTKIFGNETKQIDVRTHMTTITGRRYCSVKNLDTGSTKWIFEERIDVQQVTL